MFRERRRGFSQAAEINDALNTRGAGGRPEITGGVQVALVEVGTASQAVYQVVSGLHPLHGRSERIGLEHVTCHDLDGVLPRAPLQTGRIAHQTPDAVSLFEQTRNEPPPDIAGGAGHQDERRVFRSAVFLVGGFLVIDLHSSVLMPIRSP